MVERDKVLLIDDEAEIRELVGLYVQREGFTFLEADTGEKGVELINLHHPDLILLDIFLPDSDGVELCKKIRELTTVPVIFVSCKDSELDKVVGLSVGGDDYISKPFSMNELIARIKAHLRRHKFYAKMAEHHRQNRQAPSKLKSKTVELDLKSHDVYVGRKKANLSAKEFQLLRFFMQHPKQVFSVEHLIQSVWGYDSTIDQKTVMMHIANLRKKIEESQQSPKMIVTVRGAGYKFDEEVSVF